MVAFVAMARTYRERMDGWSWAGMVVIETALILALRKIVTIWASYANADRRRDAHAGTDGADRRLRWAVVWIGLAFYGLAARGAKALPAGVGWVFVIVAVIRPRGAIPQLLDHHAVLVDRGDVRVDFGLIAMGGSLVPASEQAPSKAPA